MKVAELLLRHVRDPRLVGVHVVRVDMTPDLGTARLYLQTLPGGAPLDEALDAARGASGFLRRELGRTLRLRAMPELSFHADDAASGERIESLLREVRGPAVGASPDDDSEE